MMHAGVCYYPEQWDRSLWAKDAELMRQSGVTLVRLAEFAWSRLEPSEGQYDFVWLDEAIELLSREGLKVVLGTPTAAPRNWLVKAYPDVLPRDAQGQPRPAGVRGHRCYTSPDMLRCSRAIVERMAIRYSSHESVIGWQIDNEFMLQRCTCASCTQGFRAWLQARYSDVLALNRAWGTAVWSGEYQNFAEITAPLGGSPQLNPSYLLDWHRYENASICAFQREQLEILRRMCPAQWVTHNSWSVPAPLDYHALFAELDLASLDYYPSTRHDQSLTQPYSGALQLDLTRGFKRKPFWIMEQLGGPPGCWMPMWRAPHPGLLRAFAWQSVSRGADAVCFFRWRSATHGAEQFWHGLLDHHDRPGRRLQEFSRFSTELSRVSSELAGTTLEAEVALLYSYEQHTALMLQPQTEGFDYYDNLKVYHRALAQLGTNVDVVDWRVSLDRYRLVVAPSLFLLDERAASALSEFACGGGTLVLTPRTGVKDLNNACWMRPLPGLLAECAGVEVDEYDPLGKDTLEVLTMSGKSYRCSQWCDLLRLEGARAYAHYAGDYLAGTPAISVNQFGRGRVYYLGTQLEPEFYVDLFREIAEELGVEQFRDLPEGVHVTVRSAGARRYTLVLNLCREARTVMLSAPYRSLLTGETFSDALALEPYGVEVLA